MLDDMLIKYLVLKKGSGSIPEYVIPFYDKEIGIEKFLEDFQGDPLVDISLGFIRMGKRLKRIINYKII